MRSFSLSLLCILGISLAFLFSPFDISDALSSSSKAECIDLEKSTFCHSLEHIETSIGHVPPSRENPNFVERNLIMDFVSSRSCITPEVSVEARFRVSSGLIEEMQNDYPSVMREALPSADVLSTLTGGSLSSIIVRSGNSESLNADNFRDALAFEGVLFPNGTLFTNYLSVTISMEACRKFGIRRNE